MLSTASSPAMTSASRHSPSQEINLKDGPNVAKNASASSGVSFITPSFSSANRVAIVRGSGMNSLGSRVLRPSDPARRIGEGVVPCPVCVHGVFESKLCDHAADFQVVPGRLKP